MTLNRVLTMQDSIQQNTSIKLASETIHSTSPHVPDFDRHTCTLCISQVSAIEAEMSFVRVTSVRARREIAETTSYSKKRKVTIDHGMIADQIATASV